jgi:hypothetical protein
MREGLSMRWQFATLIALAACQWSDGRESAQADVAEHMEGHFEAASLIKQAVIDGDLEATRAHARDLASHREPQGVRGPPSTLRQMRSTASHIGEAADISEAATLLGELAAACGNCHRASDAQPGFPIDASELATSDAPPPALDAVAHMLRHQWAADRMWEGLITPSEQYWMWGAGALQEAALHRTDLTEEPSDVNVTRLAIRVHEIGLEATRASPLEERASLYGELLQSCAACHGEIRR